VQVFHCLQHDGTGGRTLLVDGFHAAHKVLEESPESFQVLCRVPIRHENIEAEGGHRNHLVGTGPVLSAHPWNRELYMIRYPPSVREHHCSWAVQQEGYQTQASSSTDRT
jgi:trimethyllysine dioxygenase